ncbi:venom carboxylesterase-6-like isoform X2 [Agrilus planipennis]|uniref:Carboxylic ester hydrolase n=1 Tax=Agrilus planipennis TaxID=224129 RepID=A0A7F5R945_AGRPL|nr:venom carboxylesterase-6-like isoform X2 [Agrilus planipennis]
MTPLTTVLLSTLCLLLSDEATGYNLTVKTNHGYVRGYEATSSANPNVTYYAFQGVPYGKPPVGSLRFQDPQPVPSWEGVINATSFKPTCAALETGRVAAGSEDCLYVNVYVPKTNKDNEELLLPVVVWFHGGGFTRGSSRNNPSYMIEKPLIVVTVSYRLGIMGFLSTLDKNAWGNAGLKDQSLALQFVKSNILHFGGNPNRVTIFGQSAGSASVEYQIVSPKSAGLFSQAIASSGSTLNEWGFNKNPLELTIRFARWFNITSNDTKEIVAGLQKIDWETLILNSQVYGKFLPSVEAESPNAFVSQSTYDLWSAGKFNKVPFLRGYNNEEGSYGKNSYTRYGNDSKTIIPAGLNMDLNSPEANEVINIITERYFPGKSYYNFTNAINFMTQHYFVRGIRKTSRDYVNSSTPLFFYKFTYVTKENYTRGANGGAGHAEEGVYVWYSRKLLNDEDVLMKDRHTTFLSNFIIYGHPTPKKDPLLQNITWPEASEGIQSVDDIRYIEIGRNLVPGINPDHEDFLFWRNLFRKYAKSTVYSY